MADWIAEVPQLNILLSGDSKQDAIQRAQVASREIVLDRIRDKRPKTLKMGYSPGTVAIEDRVGRKAGRSCNDRTGNTLSGLPMARDIRSSMLESCDVEKVHDSGSRRIPKAEKEAASNG